MPKSKSKMHYVVNEKLLSKIEALAAQGLTQNQIARCLDWSFETYYTKKKKHPEMEDAISRGQSKGVALVTNLLMESAKNGNVTAMIFFLKNRDPENWKDRIEQKTEVSGYIEQSVNFTVEIQEDGSLMRIEDEEQNPMIKEINSRILS